MEFQDLNLQFDHALKWSRCKLSETDFTDRQKSIEISVGASFSSALPPPPSLLVKIPLHDDNHNADA